MKKLVIKVGEYKKGDKMVGEYVKVGVIMDNDNGEYAILDPTVNLAGCLTKQNMFNHSKGKKTGHSVMCSIFTDEPKPDQRQPGSDDDFDDDIGF